MAQKPSYRVDNSLAFDPNEPNSNWAYKKSSTKPKPQPTRLGVGITRQGYNLPPVALPGMTRQDRNRMAAISSSRKMPRPSGSLKNRVGKAINSIPGRMFSQQALWSAAGIANDAILSARQQKDEDTDYWNTVDTLGDVVSAAAGYVNPILGAVAKPIISGIGQMADQFVENQRKGLLDEVAKGCPPSSFQAIECYALREKMKEEAVAKEKQEAADFAKQEEDFGKCEKVYG